MSKKNPEIEARVTVIRRHKRENCIRTRSDLTHSPKRGLTTRRIRGDSEPPLGALSGLHQLPWPLHTTVPVNYHPPQSDWACLCQFAFAAHRSATVPCSSIEIAGIIGDVITWHQ